MSTTTLPAGPLAQLNAGDLAQLAAALEADYQALCSQGLALDLTRGKPASDQLDLSNHLDGALQGNYRAEDGTDTRNYGGLHGIPEARRLGAELMQVQPQQVLAAGNTSLFLMHQILLLALLRGLNGPASAWAGEAAASGAPLRFICPVPGYDRHFTITEDLGIGMLPVPMLETGPDMDMVEAMVRSDPMVKGIWNVPRFSNPTGVVYSDDTVRRMAELPSLAGPNFLVMWDDAYAVHGFGADAPALAALLPLAEAAGTADQMFITASTSKITFAGAGVAFAAASERTMARLVQHLSVMMIGPDKVNQLRHARLLPDSEAVARHMSHQADLIRPRFDAVLATLEQDLAGREIGDWTRPAGGYFISFDALPGQAQAIVNLAAGAGIKLTPAGATFPYGTDPDDRNIRLAPSFPPLAQVQAAASAFTLCVKLQAVRALMRDNPGPS